MRNIILSPALAYALEREHITTMEEKILRFLIDQDDMQMKSQDLSHFGIKDSRRKSYHTKKLREK